jgi:signal transduction histidine kinase
MLLSYLKRHVKIILLFLIFSLLFAVIFCLYDMPVEAVVYASALCFIVGAIMFVIGFCKYLRRHRVLLDMRNCITVSLDGLPAARGALEQDYQELLYILWNYAARIDAKAATERREAMDYYTLWVHQIKTPISAMRLLLQSDDSKCNSALETELFHIEHYVEMVLSYLRLDSDSSDYVLHECELDNILRHCIRKYAKMFILKKLTLNFKETGLKVMTDEKWLAFVIEQLLSNSLKYTHKGVVSIFADGFVLAISDTGIGIRAEDLPRVFEKGFTGFNGREDKKSTGLGLYLCRRVCNKLGHRLKINSNLGTGTTVYIDLTPGKRVIE